MLEVALSKTTARELAGARRGRRLVLSRIRASPRRVVLPLHDQRPLAVVIVGLFEVIDPNAPFWFGDPTVDRPNLEFTPDLSMKIVYAQAVVSPAAYPVPARGDEPLPASRTSTATSSTEIGSTAVASRALRAPANASTRAMRARGPTSAR